MGGLLEFNKCDVNLLVVYFNVDFSRAGGVTQLLLDFMDEWDLCARDPSYPDTIPFTYERDDGLATSWVDHVLCSNHKSTIVSHVTCVPLDSNLSDHHPIAFTLNVDCSLMNNTSPSPPLFSSSLSLDWDKASREDLDN